MRNNPHLTSEEIGRQIELTREGVRYHIKKLKKKGLIERKGSSKKGSWKIKKNINP